MVQFKKIICYARPDKKLDLRPEKACSIQFYEIDIEISYLLCNCCWVERCLKNHIDVSKFVGWEVQTII